MVRTTSILAPDAPPRIAPLALTYSEAGQAAGVSERHIRRAVANRELAVCHLGSSHCSRIRVQDLQK